MGTIFCQQCGTKNENSEFCINCGTKLNTTSSTPVNKKSSKNLLIGIIAVALAIAVIVLLIFTIFGKDSPEKAVHRYEKAINAKNIDKLLSCYQPSVAKPIKAVVKLAKVTGQDLQDLFNTYALPYLPKDDVINIKIYGKEKTDTNSYDINTSVGTIPVIKENGKWYIDFNLF